MEGRIKAEYYIETTEEAEKAAELMARMQSTGTWSSLDSETGELVRRHGAKVEKVEQMGEKDCYSLPTRLLPGKKVSCARIEISYPVINFGSNISMLLTTVAGEIFDMQELTAVKVLDVEMDENYTKKFPGPKFGIEGCREITGASGRPLFGAIVKPCVGLSPAEIASVAAEAAKAGADFIKDDELLADAPYNSVKDRVAAVSGALKSVYEKSGKKTLYAFNITDDPARAAELYDVVADGGGSAVMFNVMAGGFNTLARLASRAEVPIHCHRDFSVAVLRSPYLGITAELFTKLTRLCGGDQVQCGGIESYIYETDDEVLQSFSACTSGPESLKKALPVSSGGMWAGKLAVNIEKIGNNDFMFLCGGGVYSHPKGGFAGMKSLKDAYEAISRGIKPEDYDTPELREAFRHFK